MDFVVHHVSDPYISTALTFKLKMHSLVGIEIYLDFHILLSTMKAALAFPILALTSLSVPPFVSMMLPRYMKDYTSSKIFPCSLIGLLFLLLIFMILILPLFASGYVKIIDKVRII